MPPSSPRRVVIVVFDGLQSLDLTGPLEVFHSASRVAAHRRRPGGSSPTPPDPGYEIVTASVDRGPVRTSSGLTITADIDPGRGVGSRSTR